MNDVTWVMVKGLVGHMGHESLSLTHLSSDLQVCQIRRNPFPDQRDQFALVMQLTLCCFILLMIYVMLFFKVSLKTTDTASTVSGSIEFRW